MKIDKPYIHILLRSACCLIGILSIQAGYSQRDKNDWLNELNKNILLSKDYDAKKVKKIDSLYNHRGRGEADFDYYLALYNEYSVFNFDSAWLYVQKMQQAAVARRDAALTGYARIKLCFTLLSAGMFKEVFDSLKTVDLSSLTYEAKADYYVLQARGYFDLADYANNSYSRSYDAKAAGYLDSSLSLFSPASFQFHYYTGLKNIRSGNISSAAVHFGELMGDSSLSLHQRAIVYSTYSDLYIRKRLPDSAIILLARAAIADIQSSTRETSAIFSLATLLFKQGDLENASVFIQKAANDATKYGARQRMVQLSNVLPLIEAEKLRAVERDKSNLVNYAFIITLLSVFLITLVFVIIRQVKKLKVQQKEINKKNMSLHHLVEEKEWLLKEIHHRVKNNLHTITSLLESQSAYLQNDALDAIRNSQHRVFAMSLIHQKLYKPENNVTSIDMSVYLQELVQYLEDSFEVGKRIKFELHTEPVNLDITLATPLGLILNEAITNAVKYAFPCQQDGIITISIRKTAENTFLFSVADNGLGLPAGFDSSNTQSLGMKLMKGLSDDIGATFQVEHAGGTRISISFTSVERKRRL